MKYKLIAMDLDGTLTQHKSKLDINNTQLLNSLAKKYEMVMVGAGSCERIYKQMNEYPITIIGNYGMQLSKIINGEFVLVRNDRYLADKIFFDETVARLREKTGYVNYVGDSVEYHASGAVTFPLLGTKAELENKLAFDPDGKKRSEIFDDVSEAFAEYNCFIGGTSSFDIVKKGYDKYSALLEFIKDTNIQVDEILFIGDDFKRGGNDEQIKLKGLDFVEIKDYTKVREELEKINLI